MTGTTEQLEERFEERYHRLLEGKEVTLGVNRWTTLIIWLKGDRLYMRLDRPSQYYVPLKRSTVRYLKHERTNEDKRRAVTELTRYGFGEHVDPWQLRRVIEITYGLEHREPIIW